MKEEEELDLELRAELRLRLQAKRRAQANTKAFVRYLYNLTSIIMDKVRRFMKFAIVEVVNYAAAM